MFRNSAGRRPGHQDAVTTEIVADPNSGKSRPFCSKAVPGFQLTWSSFQQASEPGWRSWGPRHHRRPLFVAITDGSTSPCLRGGAPDGRPMVRTLAVAMREGKVAGQRREGDGPVSSRRRPTWSTPWKPASPPPARSRRPTPRFRLRFILTRPSLPTTDAISLAISWLATFFWEIPRPSPC